MECSIVGGHPRFLEQQAYSGTTKSFSFIQVPSQIFLCSFLFFLGGGVGVSPPKWKRIPPPRCCNTFTDKQQSRTLQRVHLLPWLCAVRKAEIFNRPFNSTCIFGILLYVITICYIAENGGPTLPKPKVLTQCQISATEVQAIRQLIAGYRESAAFLYRSADELEALLPPL